MDEERWLVGWRDIGKYIGKSAKTAMRYSKKDGMPFFRDPGGRPMAKPSMLDEYILELNRGEYHGGQRPWNDDGIHNAITCAEIKEKELKDFEQRFLEAQKPPRTRY